MIKFITGICPEENRYGKYGKGKLEINIYGLTDEQFDKIVEKLREIEND